MKRRSLVFCLLLPALLDAQEANCDFQKLLDDGKAAARTENYELALNKFNSARRCDPDKGPVIDREVEKLFDAINQKKNQADTERQRAETQTQEARAAREEADKQARIARAALDSLAILNTDKVRLMLAEVARNQEDLNFAAAIDKLKTARILLALPDSVELAYKNLSRALLYHAREDIGRLDYHPALDKIKSAEDLNTLPDEVQAANHELRQFLFDNARLDILHTEYDAATEKMTAAQTLGVSPDTVGAVLFELAFCYAETGRPGRAANLLDTIAQLRNNNTVLTSLRDLAGKPPAQQLQVLRQARQQLDPQRNSRLQSRYLPADFAKIPGGTLALSGDPRDESRSTCPVTIQPFMLGTKEVSFFEYDLFCTATGRPKPSDKNWGRGQRPVIDIDWYDAVAYCNWRSRQEGLEEIYTIDTTAGDPATRNSPAGENWRVSINASASGYRLPTEAEWEFAAGNGEKHTRYSWGDEEPATQPVGNVTDVTIQAKFPDWEIFAGYSDAFAYTAPTGAFPPNSFGLHDMSGNVWEWCWDRYDVDYCRAGKKPNALKDVSADRVLRGGSWGSFPKDCQVRNRFHKTPETRNFSIGFRLAKSIHSDE